MGFSVLFVRGILLSIKSKGNCINVNLFFIFVFWRKLRISILFLEKDFLIDIRLF